MGPSTKAAHPQPPRLIYEWGPFHVDATWTELVGRWMVTLLAGWLTICAGAWVSVAVGMLLEHDLHTELKQRPRGLLTLLHQSVRQHLDTLVTVHWGQTVIGDVLNGFDQRHVLWPSRTPAPTTTKRARSSAPGVLFGPVAYARFTEAACFRKPESDRSVASDPTVRYEQAWLQALERPKAEDRTYRLDHAELRRAIEGQNRTIISQFIGESSSKQRQFHVERLPVLDTLRRPRSPEPVRPPTLLPHLHDDDGRPVVPRGPGPVVTEDPYRLGLGAAYRLLGSSSYPLF